MKREEHGAWVGKFPPPSEPHEEGEVFDRVDMMMAKAIGFFTAIVTVGIGYILFEGAVWLQIVKP